MAMHQIDRTIVIQARPTVHRRFNRSVYRYVAHLKSIAGASEVPGPLISLPGVSVALTHIGD